MGQKYAQGDSNGNIIAYYDDAINSAGQIGITAIKITNAQWLDCVQNPNKYIINSGAIALAPGPTQPQLDAEAWAAYQGEARAALADSDTTMHRICEGVALGTTSWAAVDVVAYANYRRQLRAMLSQSQPTTIPAALPAKPAYPAGT